MVEFFVLYCVFFFVCYYVVEIVKMFKDDEICVYCFLFSGIIQEIFKDKFEEIEIFNKEEKIIFEFLWIFYLEGSIFGIQFVDEVFCVYKVNKIIFIKEKVEIKCEIIMFSGYFF